MTNNNVYMPQGSTPQTASFTCNTCGVKFPTAELQRQHMKTDWHRYNLKRRVAQLPSIPSDLFAELVLSKQQQLTTNFADEDEYGFAINHRKTKSGMRQLTKKDLKKQQLHQRGRPESVGDMNRERDPSATPSVQSIHSEFSEFSISSNLTEGGLDRNVSAHSDYNYSEISQGEYTEEEFLYSDEDAGTDSDVTTGSDIEDDDNEEDEIVITNCFYCGSKSSDIEENIRHMFKKHGLYIPERSYLVDVEGLLQFLGEVIIEYKECLTCGFLGKNTESIRQHMSSKRHSKIPYETKEEKAMISEFYNFNVETKKKSTKSSKAVAFGEDVMVLEHDDEEVDEGDDDDEEGENSNYSTVSIDASGVELILPTGSRIGHRSMTRYYRQNLALPRDLNESERTLAVADRRYAPGLTTKEVTKQEKFTRRVEQRSKNEFYRKDKSSQINFQRHFRDVLLGPM